MQTSEFEITYSSSVITRLDRVIHMMKWQLNEVYHWYFRASAYAHLQIHTHRKSIAWIARLPFRVRRALGRAMTDRKVGTAKTVKKTATASLLTPLRGAALGW